MAVLRTTPDFIRWVLERGYKLSDLESPPVAYMLVELYKFERDAYGR